MSVRRRRESEDSTANLLIFERPFTESYDSLTAIGVGTDDDLGSGRRGDEVEEMAEDAVEAKDVSAGERNAEGEGEDATSQLELIWPRSSREKSTHLQGTTTL